MDQVLKRFERGEIERVDWLDPLAMRAIDGLRRQQHTQQLAGLGGAEPPGGSGSGLQLAVELLTFPQAVIFQQASVPAPGHAAPAALTASTTDALATPLPGTSGTGVVAPGAAGAASGSGAGAGIILLHDPEIGRENPAELKAQKLARSVTRGMVDRNLKPDTEERQRIDAVLSYPPNRCGRVCGVVVVVC